MICLQCNLYIQRTGYIVNRLSLGSIVNDVFPFTANHRGPPITVGYVEGAAEPANSTLLTHLVNSCILCIAYIVSHSVLFCSVPLCITMFAYIIATLQYARWHRSLRECHPLCSGSPPRDASLSMQWKSLTMDGFKLYYCCHMRNIGHRPCHPVHSAEWRWTIWTNVSVHYKLRRRSSEPVKSTVNRTAVPLHIAFRMAVMTWTDWAMGRGQRTDLPAVISIHNITWHWFSDSWILTETFCFSFTCLNVIFFRWIVSFVPINVVNLLFVFYHRRCVQLHSRLTVSFIPCYIFDSIRYARYDYNVLSEINRQYCAVPYCDVNAPPTTLHYCVLQCFIMLQPPILWQTGTQWSADVPFSAIRTHKQAI